MANSDNKGSEGITWFDSPEESGDDAGISWMGSEDVEEPEEDVGFFDDLGTDILKAGARGIIGLGEMTARIPRAFDAPGGNDFIRDLTDPVVEGARYLLEKDPLLQYSDANKASYVRRAITGGIESAPQSALGMVTAAALGPAGWVGLFTTFGANQFSQYIDDAMEQGKTYEESLPYALASATVEGGFETLSDVLGAKFLKIGGAGKLFAGSSKTIKDLLTTTFGSYLKGTLKQMPVEVGTEVIQGAGEALIQQLQGIEGPSAQDAMLESIGPAIVMTALFGAGSAGMNKVREKQVREILESPDADPQERKLAAGYVYEQLASLDKEKDTMDAELWSAIANGSIDQGLPINLDVQISEAQEAIEEKDKADDFIVSLRNDLANGVVSADVAESIKVTMPQHAEEIDKVVAEFKAKDPSGAIYQANSAIGKTSEEVDARLESLFAPALTRLEADVKTGLVRKGPVIPAAMPELAEKEAKVSAEVLEKADELYLKRDLAIRESRELEQIAEKIKNKEPVDYWHLDEEQLAKLGYIVGEEVKEQAPPEKIINAAGQILVGEVPDLSKMTKEELDSINSLVEEGQLEKVQAIAKVREKKKLPEKAIELKVKKEEIAKPEEKLLIKPSEKSKEELVAEAEAKKPKTFLEKAAERVGAAPAEKPVKTREVTFFDLKGIASVKAVRNKDKRFDLINQKTKENIFPDKDFRTPREAKDYFDGMKKEEAAREAKIDKAETPLDKIIITRKAVHAGTGETIEIKESAQTAISEIEEQQKIYRNLLECV